jgi:hypothetical protein
MQELRAQNEALGDCYGPVQRTNGATGPAAASKSYGTVFVSRVSRLITQVALQTTSAVAVTPTECRYQVGTWDHGTLTFTPLCETANDTSMFTVSNTVYVRSFDTARGLAANLQLVRAGVYAVIAICDAPATYPTFRGNTGGTPYPLSLVPAAGIQKVAVNGTTPSVFTTLPHAIEVLVV